MPGTADQSRRSRAALASFNSARHRVVRHIGARPPRKRGPLSSAVIYAGWVLQKVTLLFMPLRNVPLARSLKRRITGSWVRELVAEGRRRGVFEPPRRLCDLILTRDTGREFLEAMGRADTLAGVYIWASSVFLLIATRVYLLAGDHASAIRCGRILNIVLRPLIRARAGATATLYFYLLYRFSEMNRIEREVRGREQISSRRQNLYIAEAFLQNGKPEMALYYYDACIACGGDSYALWRSRGKALLLLGHRAEAEDCFRRSVERFPPAVMSHQNYAGRYDISTYTPAAWELENAGPLVVYDVLGQLAEDQFLRGEAEKSMALYKAQFNVQDELAIRFPLPPELRRRIEAYAASRNFTLRPHLPLRLLSYEWVTQFGHIGLVDIYLKMMRVGLVPEANVVLLAPFGKIANAAFLSYWESHILIIRDPDLIDALFPFQRIIGDGFNAFRSDTAIAEPWTRAGARAQVRYDARGYPPLLSLRCEDRQYGEATLAALGVPPGAWYVGLHVREGGFHGDGAGATGNHRNARIEDYLPAIREITSRGGWVIRLGDSTMTPLPRMEKVVDYARSSVKSERMDLFLLATARFVLGTTSGLTTATLAFGTPMLLVNCISNDWQMWSDKTHFILRPVVDIRSGRLLSLAETYRWPLQGYIINSVLLRRKGYQSFANSAEDIRMATAYKLDILMGQLSEPDETHPALRRYRKVMAANPVNFGAARPVVPFLEAHPELLEDLRPAPDDTPGALSLLPQES